MAENLVVIAIVGVAAALIGRRFYLTLTGQGKQCACAKNSCASGTPCEAQEQTGAVKRP